MTALAFQIESSSGLADIIAAGMHKPASQKVGSLASRVVIPSFWDNVSAAIHSYWLQFVAWITNDLDRQCEHYHIPTPSEFRTSPLSENPEINGLYQTIISLLRKGHQLNNTTVIQIISRFQRDIAADPELRSFDFCLDLLREDSTVPSFEGCKEIIRNRYDMALEENQNKVIFIPLSVKGIKGRHLIGVTIDLKNGCIKYYDPKGYPIEAPKNWFGVKPNGCHLRDFIDFLKEHFGIDEERVQNLRCHQFDIHSCGVHFIDGVMNQMTHRPAFHPTRFGPHLLEAMRKRMQGKEVRLTRDPDVARVYIEDTRTRLAQTLVLEFIRETLPKERYVNFDNLKEEEVNLAPAPASPRMPDGYPDSDEEEDYEFIDCGLPQLPHKRQDRNPLLSSRDALESPSCQHLVTIINLVSNRSLTSFESCTAYIERQIYWNDPALITIPIKIASPDGENESYMTITIDRRSQKNNLDTIPRDYNIILNSEDGIVQFPAATLLDYLEDLR